MAANAIRAGTREPISRAPPEAPPSAAIKPSEVLTKAADLIEPEGAWTQRQMRNGCARCALAAISDAAIDLTDGPGSEVYFRARGIMARMLKPRLARWEPTDWPIIDFNDTRGRKQRRVVAALREAADLARSEGQ